MVWFQEVRDQFNTACNEIYKLRPHIREMGLQAIQHALKKDSFSKDITEEGPYLLWCSFLPERRVKENGLKEVQKLNLSNELLIDDRMAQDLGKWWQDEFN